MKNHRLRHRRRPAARGHAAGGFSMLEVLIAVLLVSTALLSLALLQVVSLRSSNSSYMRTEAVVLANDIADKMRANRVNVASYPIALGASGTAGTMAGDDVVAWKNALAAGLPGGDGSIVISAGVATITIDWLDGSIDATQDQTSASTTNTRFQVRATL